MTDTVLAALGLALRGGNLAVGEEPVAEACRTGKARVVLLASDAAGNTARRATRLAGENVPLVPLPRDKSQVGFALGRGSCAMLALTDAGFAASLTQKLAARAPERYGPAAQQLRIKADRVLQRQREQRQHEKNLREGKKAPWAPPPPKRTESPKQNGRPAQNGKQSSRKTRGGSAPHPSAPGVRNGSGLSSRSGGSHKPGPGGRRLSGKFRNNP